MRILITGGRYFENRELLEKVLDQIHATHRVGILVHGDASGADRLADDWARSRQITVEAYAANWKKYGRAAGPVRNQQMLTQMPDLVIAFPGGKGTKDMVSRAKMAGLRVVEAHQAIEPNL